MDGWEWWRLKDMATPWLLLQLLLLLLSQASALSDTLGVAPQGNSRPSRGTMFLYCSRALLWNSSSVCVFTVSVGAYEGTGGFGRIDLHLS